MSQWIDSFDLEAYLQQFKPTHIQAQEVSITCPICGKEKLIVNVARKAWHCWVCEEYKLNYYGRKQSVHGAGGLLDLIQLLEGCTRDRAVAIVSEQTNHLSVSTETVQDELVVDHEVAVHAAPHIQPPPGWRPIESYVSLPYLRQRGILPEDVPTFGLLYCDTGLYVNRLIFPVWEAGALVYYQARAMWESEDPRFRKSMNPTAQLGMASPNEVVMNLDVARHYPRVALVEGPIDNVHAGPAAVATFGKKISMVQALKIRKAGVQALDLMWDGPTLREPMGAWPEMMKAASMLSGMFDVRLVFLPRGDPGDYSRLELDRFRSLGVAASAVSRLALL